MSPNGIHVVSCGSDQVLRLYERTDQTLVLQDEEEEEREEMEQQQLATGDQQTVVPSQPGLKLAGKKTVGSEKGAESIMECLEICAEFGQELEEYSLALSAKSGVVPAAPVPPPLMRAFDASTCEDFILETLRRIRAR